MRAITLMGRAVKKNPLNFPQLASDKHIGYVAVKLAGGESLGLQ